ncbi:Uncharacterised protein [Campylobacter hyointestinalis subsp. hyointestinalis]|uniref:Uncharacterized protein n=1 Tax=Campylobacter hyointestinalis subsp. hyointestinalis TaxID=91352 RepID=A0A0S4SU30_CAMHY|nr:hypothetical protein [Campylobacter hyointestinalis]CUU89966.1 Uncharacterised protein [Campylobacter hyointestinalis subsp. hyointestinalis]
MASEKKKEENIFELLGLIQPNKVQFTALYKTTNKLLEEKISTIEEYKSLLSNVLNYISIFARLKDIADMKLSDDDKIIALTYFCLFDNINFYIYHITVFKNIDAPVSSSRINEKVIANISKLDNSLTNIFICQCYNNNLLRQIA